MKENRDFFNGLLQDYVKSNTIEDLVKHREALLAELESSKQQYIVAWQRKEESFITYFTKRYANLSTYSTQSGESFYRIIKDSLHPAISLLEACKRITKAIDNEVKNLYKAENNSRCG